jgi:hypothetical protein
VTQERTLLDAVVHGAAERATTIAAVVKGLAERTYTAPRAAERTVLRVPTCVPLSNVNNNNNNNNNKVRGRLNNVGRTNSLY